MDQCRDGNPERDNKQQQRAQLKKKKSITKSALKVVYISSPMKVKTCASNFRSLVQELTGRESDVVKPMDFNNHHNHDHRDNDGFKCIDDYLVVAGTSTAHYDHQTVKTGVSADSATYSESPTTSSSVSGSGSGSGSVFFDNHTFDDFITVPNIFDESCCDAYLFPSGYLYDSFSEAQFVRNYDLV